MSGLAMFALFALILSVVGLINSVGEEGFGLWSILFSFCIAINTYTILNNF
jgi:hypothetical protein